MVEQMNTINFMQLKNKVVTTKDEDKYLIIWD